MMITAAEYERKMLEHRTNLYAPLSAERAVMETVEVLKQFGYDAGAELFRDIAYETVRGHVIKSFDV